jgi:CheY-like chemotaxis protein
MSVFDPSLDGNSIWPAWRDERETAMLRHDIRTALADVAGGARQLARADLDPEARLQVERIAASAKALEWLAAQAFGEPCEGPAETDVDRLIGHLRRRFAGAARELGTDFRVEMDPGLPSRLRLDPVTLNRLLGNLVAGALARARGGSVAIVARLESGEIVFRVTDERRAGRSADPAAGVIEAGDPLAQTLADRLEGRLDLVGAVDGRTEATLRFAGAVAVAPSPAAAADPRLAGIRILLAEDNPTNQMVASNMLRALDAEVLVCGDGVEALERFDAWPADLVVVDIEMPRLTGLDVIRAIRGRTDAKAHVPIVALTAYAMREHRDRIAAAGANGLIPKPITSIEALGRDLAAHVRRGAVHAAGEGDEPENGAPPAMDMAVFEQLCRTIGPDLVGELMDKVVADLVDGRARLEGALEPFDRAQIEGTAHILISVAGAVGAARLQARARALNSGCRDPRMPREAIAAEVRRCIAEIDATVGFARGRGAGA